MQLLLEEGTNVDVKDSRRRTPLFWAAYGGHKAVVQLLLENGANINAQGMDERTVLHKAARHGDKTTARLLLLRKLASSR